MEIEFTTHILRDSSKRIKSPKMKSSRLLIKKYFSFMFRHMMTHDEINGKRVKHFYDSDAVRKVVCGEHKFVYKKRMDNIFVLITYARKTESDKSFHSLLNLTRKYSGKKYSKK